MKDTATLQSVKNFWIQVSKYNIFVYGNYCVITGGHNSLLHAWGIKPQYKLPDKTIK